MHSVSPAKHWDTTHAPFVLRKQVAALGRAVRQALADATEGSVPQTATVPTMQSTAVQAALDPVRDGLVCTAPVVHQGCAGRLLHWHTC